MEEDSGLCLGLLLGLAWWGLQLRCWSSPRADLTPPRGRKKPVVLGELVSPWWLVMVVGY